MFTMLQIILGSIGCTVFQKTPCPVLVVFLVVSFIFYDATDVPHTVALYKKMVLSKEY